MVGIRSFPIGARPIFRGHVSFRECSLLGKRPFFLVGDVFHQQFQASRRNLVGWIGGRAKSGRKKRGDVELFGRGHGGARRGPVRSLQRKRKKKQGIHSLCEGQVWTLILCVACANYVELVGRSVHSGSMRVFAHQLVTLTSREAGVNLSDSEMDWHWETRLSSRWWLRGESHWTWPTGLLLRSENEVMVSCLERENWDANSSGIMVTLWFHKRGTFLSTKMAAENPEEFTWDFPPFSRHLQFYRRVGNHGEGRPFWKINKITTISWAPTSSKWSYNIYKWPY